MTTTRKRAAPAPATLPGPQPTLYESESAASQSMHYLMIAAQVLQILHYRGPVDMRHEQQVRTAVQEIWPEMADKMDDTRAVNAKRALLPQTEGMYYLVYLNTLDGKRMPILIPEGDVVAQVFAWAAKEGKDAALKVLYRYGLLPRA